MLMARRLQPAAYERCLWFLGLREAADIAAEAVRKCRDAGALHEGAGMNGKALGPWTRMDPLLPFSMGAATSSPRARLATGVPAFDDRVGASAMRSQSQSRLTSCIAASEGLQNPRNVLGPIPHGGDLAASWAA